MMVNWLATNPIATSILKTTIPALESDPFADAIGQIFLGGKK